MNPLSRLLGRDDPHTLAAPYALHALEPAERARFEKHLRRCTACQAEVRALTEDAARLAWTTSAPAPPQLRDRVLSAVRATTQEQPAAPARSTQLPPHVWGVREPPRQEPRRAFRRASVRRPLLMPFATATAAAALVVAGLFAVQANDTREQLNAERARVQRINEVLAAPDARAGVSRDPQGRSIGVVASPSTGKAVVTLSGYDDLPAGKVNQLWLLRPGAPPLSLGLFDRDTPLLATGLQRNATSLAVTVEPDGGSPQPTSQPFVQLALNSVGFGE